MLRHDGVVARDDLGIFALLEHHWPVRPFFWKTAAEAAMIWQTVAEFESDLGPVAQAIARRFLNNAEMDFTHTAAQMTDQLDAFEATLEGTPFLAGDKATACQFWLFPTLGWIDHAIDRAERLGPQKIRAYLTTRP